MVLFAAVGFDDYKESNETAGPWLSRWLRGERGVMKVAVACQESRLSSEVAPRFARAPFYFVYDTDSAHTNKLASGSRVKMPPDGGLSVAVALLNAEVDAVIAGKFGHRVAEFFDGANVTVYEAPHLAGSYALDRFLHE